MTDPGTAMPWTFLVDFVLQLTGGGLGCCLVACFTFHELVFQLMSDLSDRYADLPISGDPASPPLSSKKEERTIPSLCMTDD